MPLSIKFYVIEELSNRDQTEPPMTSFHPSNQPYHHPDEAEMPYHHPDEAESDMQHYGDMAVGLEHEGRQWQELYPMQRNASPSTLQQQYQHPHHLRQNPRFLVAHRHSSLPPPSETYIHPERCPPLDLEFLWKIYRRRAGTNANSASSRRMVYQDRIGVLQSQGFPTGLASMMLQHATDHPIRIFLVDNSGTMHQNDAQLVSQSSSGKVLTVECTRWEAITSTIIWHAEMAAWCQTPMAVRLLHDPGISVGPQQMGISASKHYSSCEEMDRLKNVLRATRPNGATSPLHIHLHDIFTSVSTVVSILTRQRRRVTLCICTDSIPSDTIGEGPENPQMIQDFHGTLDKLLDWPVQVVFRLSTKEHRVVQFYQELIARKRGVRLQEQSLPIPGFEESSSSDTGGATNFHEHLQVLDDYVSECERIQAQNPWLNYGYPLHLCREEGICIKAIEALSQRPLLVDEVLDVAGYLFGQKISDNAPTNEVQYHAFLQRIVDLNLESGVLWNPAKKKFVPWIDLKRLDKIYFHQGKRGKGTSHGGGNVNYNDKSSKCAIM